MLEFSIAVLAEGLTGPVSYTAENLPAGAMFNDGTGRVQWTPTADQVGVYSAVTFRVANREDEIVEVISIIVARRTGIPTAVWQLYR